LISLQSQKTAILAHLKTGRSITPLEALRLFGCLRLGARIHELKGEGHAIHSERVEVGPGKRVASYTLVQQ